MKAPRDEIGNALIALKENCLLYTSVVVLARRSDQVLTQCTAVTRKVLLPL